MKLNPKIQEAKAKAALDAKIAELENSRGPAPIVPQLAANDNILLEYQAESIVTARLYALLFIEKSRRIGLTWGMASYAVLTASSRKSAGGMKVWYMGYDQEMAREFIDTCGRWALAFGVVAKETGEVILSDEHGDIKAFRITFDSGFEIVALPAVARALRGKQGLVILDEAAFMSDLEEVLKAALALMIWGGRVVVISTHDGIDNPFNVMLDEIKAGKRKGGHIKITFDDAIAAGLYERIKLVSPANDNFPSKPDWIKEIRDTYGDNADEELDVNPKAGGSSWITIEDYTGAEHSECGKPDLYQGGRIVIGRDVARRRDYAVIWVFEILGEVMWLREIWEGQNVSFREQDIVFDGFMKKYPNAVAAIDQTGMGEKVVEDLQYKWGEYRVKGVLFTPSMKLVLATVYREQFEKGLIRIVRDPVVKSDHRSLKRASRTSKALAEGDVHPDRFWAGALAAWLKDQGFAQYDYQPVNLQNANDDDDDEIPGFGQKYSGGMTRHGMSRNG